MNVHWKHCIKKLVKYLNTDLFSFDKIGEYITNSSNVKLSEF